MKPATCPLPFDAILRARLVALITDVHGRTLSGLGVAMGHARTWLTRKLGDDQAQPKPTTLDDCTEVLRFLGEPPDRLFAPVLVDGDDELLVHAAGAMVPGLAGVATGMLIDTAEPAPSVRRLLAQGLVVLEGPDTRALTLRITDLGQRALTTRVA